MCLNHHIWKMSAHPLGSFEDASTSERRVWATASAPNTTGTGVSTLTSSLNENENRA